MFRLTDHLDMAMTVDWDFKSQTRESQNSSRGQSYLYSMVSNQSKHKSRCRGAAVVKWINSPPYKLGFAGSILGFTNLTDETLTGLSPRVNISLTVPRRWVFCGSFLLVMLYVGVCCAVVTVPRSHVVTYLERADLLAVLCFLVPNESWFTSELRARLAP